MAKGLSIEVGQIWHHGELDSPRPHHERTIPPQLSGRLSENFAETQIPLKYWGEP